MKKLGHWKLLADLNISIKTVAFLRELGADIIRVDKSVETDEGVVEQATREGRTILTFDKDFGEIYYFHHNKNITVIVLYLEDQTSENVNKNVQQFLTEVYPESVHHKLVILYTGRYRLRS